MNLTRNLKKWLFPLAGILALTAILFLYRAHAWWHKPSVNPYIAVYIDIPTGRSLRDIATQLQTMGVIDNAHYFVSLARWHHHLIKAGEYVIPASATPAAILKQLNEGKVLQYAMTVVDGWNVTQLQTAINAQPRLKHAFQHVPLTEWLAQLGVSATGPTEWPEGLFYPDTYFYTANTDDKVILQRAYRTMQTRLQQAWEKRAANCCVIN